MNKQTNKWLNKSHMQAQQQLQDVGFEREDAMAAVEKLHSVINMVQAEMAEAQEAADR